MEEIVLNLIMHSGEARSYAMEAIELAKNDQMDGAIELINKSNEELGHSHQSQSGLVNCNCMKDNSKYSLLLMHAEDHLMTSMTINDLASEIVQIYEKICFK